MCFYIFFLTTNIINYSLKKDYVLGELHHDIYNRTLPYHENLKLSLFNETLTHD